MTADLDERIRVTLSAVAEQTAVPKPPTAAAPNGSGSRRSRRWRIGVGSLIVGSASVVCVGAAAASGVFSHGASVAFSDEPGVNPADAILVASLPGPADTTIKVYAAPAAHDNQCESFVLTGDPSWAGYSVGGGCTSTKALPDGSVEGGSSLSDIRLSVGDRATIAMYAYRNPDATSAQVVDGDGRVWPVVVDHGYLAGWLPEASFRTGYLTARNAAGSIVQQGPVGPPAVSSIAP
jgi:hypothetical protein